MGCLSAAHEDRAVTCLEEHGLVILPGLLTSDAVLARGEQALEVGGWAYALEAGGPC